MTKTSEVVLYVGPDRESEQAVEILKKANVPVAVRQTASWSYYRVAYGTPVLFALSTRFEGVQGIHVFLENARVLGYRPSAADQP